MRVPAIYDSATRLTHVCRPSFCAPTLKALAAAAIGRQHTGPSQPQPDPCSVWESARTRQALIACSSGRRSPGEADGSGTSQATLLDWALDPSGNRVYLIALALLACIFVLPRLLLISFWGVERSAVAVLLSIERVALAAGWVVLRWAAYALFAFALLSLVLGYIMLMSDRAFDAFTSWYTTERSQLDESEAALAGNERALTRLFRGVGDGAKQFLVEQKAQRDRQRNSKPGDGTQ